MLCCLATLLVVVAALPVLGNTTAVPERTPSPLDAPTPAPEPTPEPTPAPTPEPTAAPTQSSAPAAPRSPSEVYSAPLIFNATFQSVDALRLFVANVTWNGSHVAVLQQAALWVRFRFSAPTVGERVLREMAFLALNETGRAAVFGISNAVFTYTMPTVSPATPLPASLWGNVSPEMQALAAKTLLWSIDCIADFRFTNGRGDVRVPELGQLGPDVAEVVTPGLGALVNLSASEARSRFLFVESTPRVAGNPLLSLVFYPALAYRATFQVTPAVLAGTSATDINVRLLALAASATALTELGAAVEGAVALRYQDAATVLTFAKVAQEGRDEYFEQKMHFLAGLLSTLAAFTLWFSVMWRRGLVLG